MPREYDNTNTGVMFKTRDRKSWQGEWSGGANIDGADYWINGDIIVDDQTGKNRMSCWGDRKKDSSGGASEFKFRLDKSAATEVKGNIEQTQISVSGGYAKVKKGQRAGEWMIQLKFSGSWPEDMISDDSDPFGDSPSDAPEDGEEADAFGDDIPF